LAKKVSTPLEFPIDAENQESQNSIQLREKERDMQSINFHGKVRRLTFYRRHE
jgi:hypothetical protein